MAVVIALCAAYAAYCLGTNPAGPITTPDSIRYLDAWPNYPLGYPLFLKAAGARWAIVIQPVVFAASLAFLGSEIVKRTRSTWLALAVVAASMLLPQVREFHASILSESLFLSLLIVFLGLAVRFAYHPAWHVMALIAVGVGVSTTVRRTGFALLPVMIVMVVMQRHRLRHPQWALCLVAALAPVLLINGAEQAIAPLVHSGPTSSLMGRHMFAKAALIDAPLAPPSSDAVREALDLHLQTDYAPIRALLAAAPGDVAGVLSMYYETCLQGGCVDRSRELMPGQSEAAQTRALGAVANDRIRRAPVAFARLLAMNYQSLWTVDRLRHPDRAPRLNAFIAAHRPMPFEQLAFSLAPDQTLEFRPVAAVRYMQLAITAMAVWTFVIAVAGVVAALRQPPMPPLLAIASTAALSAHGALLLTALLAAGFSRFTIGVWPLIATAAIVGAWAVLERLRQGATSRPAVVTAR